MGLMSMVKNYELKRYCLENNLQKVAAYISKNYFISEKYQKQALVMSEFNRKKSLELIDIANMRLNNAKSMSDLFCSSYGDLTMKIATQLNHNQYERKIYLKNRIGQFFMTKKCYFLTLTFNNLTLENTSQETRRRYVARFLKTQSADYVANIDYGKMKALISFKFAVFWPYKINHSALILFHHIIFIIKC